MKIENIKKVSVVGAGLMGKQIALNNAIHGYDSWLNDSITEVLPKVQEWAEGWLAKKVEKGKMSQEDVNATLARFHVEADLAKCVEGAQLVIEAIIEKEDIKKELFTKLNTLAPKDALIVTNSSFMPSSKFASCIDDPSRMANLHYFNPALVMKLIEVVTGEHTSEETAETLMEFARKTGKLPARIYKEYDGFIVNNVSTAVTLTALDLVAKGVTTPYDVDIALENGLNYPMGPFRLMDLTGIDLSYIVLKERVDKGEVIPGFDLVEEKYLQGKYGRKTGSGWYDYTK